MNIPPASRKNNRLPIHTWERLLMITGKQILFPVTLLLLCVFAAYAFGPEVNGWIKGNPCWVVESPAIDASIVGAIDQKATVTVEDLGNGWGRIIFAPVRNLIEGRDGMSEGQLYICDTCYIQMKNVSTVPPDKW